MARWKDERKVLTRTRRSIVGIVRDEPITYNFSAPRAISTYRQSEFASCILPRTAALGFQKMGAADHNRYRLSARRRDVDHADKKFHPTRGVLQR